jgi:hypothetical protein
MPATLLPLEKMSRADKLREMEALWADLSGDADKLNSPAWHHDALRETERLVEQGKAKFSDWESAKRRIRRKIASPVALEGGSIGACQTIARSNSPTGI